MYCTVDDIANELTAQKAAQLSNDADPDTLNVGLIEQYITEASDLINNYLRGRYPLPLQNNHTLIKKVCIDIVRYELYKRRAAKMEDDIKTFYEDALSKLNKVQRGDIILDEGNADSRPKHIVVSERARMFTQDLLDGY
jgi:phage gp36-like protein